MACNDPPPTVSQKKLFVSLPWPRRSVCASPRPPGPPPSPAQPGIGDRRADPGPQGHRDPAVGLYANTDSLRVYSITNVAAGAVTLAASKAAYITQVTGDLTFPRSGTVTAPLILLVKMDTIRSSGRRFDDRIAARGPPSANTCVSVHRDTELVTARDGGVSVGDASCNSKRREGRHMKRSIWVLAVIVSAFVVVGTLVRQPRSAGGSPRSPPHHRPPAGFGSARRGLIKATYLGHGEDFPDPD